MIVKYKIKTVAAAFHPDIISFVHGVSDHGCVQYLAQG